MDPDLLDRLESSDHTDAYELPPETVSQMLDGIAEMLEREFGRKPAEAK